MSQTVITLKALERVDDEQVANQVDSMVRALTELGVGEEELAAEDLVENGTLSVEGEDAAEGDVGDDAD